VLVLAPVWVVLICHRIAYLISHNIRFSAFPFWLRGNNPRCTVIDLYKTIQDLYTEKEKLQSVIASQIDLQRGAGGEIPLMPKIGKRRGRKSMSDEERQTVSVRMKKYWSVRRHAAPANEA